MTSPVFVGVDVAKDQLDAAVRPRGDRWREGNDEVPAPSVQYSC
jgi:hypothetical protein